MVEATTEQQRTTKVLYFLVMLYYFVVFLSAQQKQCIKMFVLSDQCINVDVEGFTFENFLEQVYPW